MGSGKVVLRASALKVDQSKEKTFFSNWDEGQVREIIASHTEVTLLAKDGQQATAFHCDSGR